MMHFFTSFPWKGEITNSKQIATNHVKDVNFILNPFFDELFMDLYFNGWHMAIYLSKLTRMTRIIDAKYVKYTKARDVRHPKVDLKV